MHFAPAVSLFLAATTLRMTAAPGDVDPALNHFPNDTVVCLAFEPSGSMLVGGDFTLFNGSGLRKVVRLQADGSLDGSFNPGPNATNSGLDAFAVQTDGRIVFGGILATIDGVTRNHIARVNEDGLLDTGFNPNPDVEIRAIILQPDGKMVVTGTFTSIGGAARNRIVRLNTNGTADLGFNPNANDLVRMPALQPDGKIIIGGPFTSVGGVTRNLIARLNTDGTVDMTFNPNVTGSAVYCVEVLADGKILLGGMFSAVGGVTRTNLARLNSGGTLDPAFTASANGLVRCSAAQADGKVIIAGGFTSVNGVARNRVARLNADGSLDMAFNPNASAMVWGIAIGPDGKVLIGGEFTQVGTTARDYFARLKNDPAPQSLTVPSRATVRWLRGGASPETHDVTFELSTDGGDFWSPVGRGTRITGGWQLNGLSLPPAGQIRARARLYSGYGNGSSGLTESRGSFSFTGQELWRQQHFDTIENAGDAADNADPDKDGLENLFEYAFASNPNAADAGSFPAWQREGDRYTLSFMQPAEVNGISYIAEFNTTLDPAGWTGIPNSATAPDHLYRAPSGAEERLYLRLRVTAP
ncbi:MAG TPA: delta-60 repeat domain-containing protein [Verrucomicrobiales bacterium]|nr:delta-60 repeat domain-containing protein [Verrucomicrobiales bacterium]